LSSAKLRSANTALCLLVGCAYRHILLVGDDCGGPLIQRQRLHALDGLRGLAAMSVVLYHAFLQSPDFSLGIFRFQPEGAVAWWATMTPLRMLWDGTLAVWLFFVLSGYVLTRKYWDGGRLSWRPYYGRRIHRLYLPVVGSAVLAVVVFSIGNALAGAPFALLPGSTSLWQVVTNLGLLGATHLPLNGVWWSMRWEVWFSLLLPPLLVVLPRIGLGPRRRYRNAPAVLGVVCAAAVALGPWTRLTFGTSPQWNRIQQYLPIFGIGVALAAFEQRLRAREHRTSAASGWGMLAVAVVALSAIAPIGYATATTAVDRRLLLGLQRLVSLVGIIGLMIVSLVWRPAIELLHHRPVQWLGSRSYSLYLVHLPIVHAVAAATGMVGCPVWFPPLIVALSVGVTALFYRYVELPSMHLAKRWGKERVRLAPDVEAELVAPTLELERVG
jgi:peptidoglycan/LPS O-acetylase OafA/YrhL